MPDIVLRDRNGNHLNFYGAEYLDAVTPEGAEIPYAAYDPETLTPENLASGVTVGDVVGTMSVPILLEDLPIELDFSGGNQSVSAPDGYAVKNAIIQQPATLIPENIAEGVDIAGIIGTLAPGKDVKIAKGSLTGSGSMATIQHGLGVVPDIIIIGTANSTTSTTANHVVFCAGISQTAKSTLGGAGGLYQVLKTSAGVTNAVVQVSRYITNDYGASVISAADENSFAVGLSTYGLYNGWTYSWFAIGGLT